MRDHTEVGRRFESDDFAFTLHDKSYGYRLHAAGESDYTQYGYDSTDEDIAVNDLVRSNTDSVGATADGVLTEVYLDRDNEIITIASLIEKETDGSDRSNISSVIHNRLENEGETGHLLQIDAALVYAVGRPITQADYTSLDSPYNLYQHTGLPPRPSPTPAWPPSRRP